MVDGRTCIYDEIKMGDTRVKASSSAWNVGAIFGFALSIKEYVNAISCYCHGKVRSSVTNYAVVRLVYEFVLSKLDHMNALLYQAFQISSPKKYRMLRTLWQAQLQRPS